MNMSSSVEPFGILFKYSPGSEFHSLERIGLATNESISDAQEAIVLELFRSYTKNTDFLVSLPRSAFIVSISGDLSDQLISKAHELFTLKAIRLTNRTITSQTLASLGQGTALSELELCDCKLNFSSDSNMRNFHQLNSLIIRNCNIPTNVLSLISDCQLLTTINLQATSANVKSLNFDSLPNLKDLRTIVLESIDCDDYAMEQIGRLPHLSRIDVSGCSFSHLSVHQSEFLQELEELNITNCPNVSDDLLTSLALLPKLTKLSLHNVKCTQRGLDLLQNCAALTELNLSYPVSDKAISTFPTIPKLKKVSIHYPISSAVSETLQNLESLEAIDLSFTELKESDIHSFFLMDSLKTLILASAHVQLTSMLPPTNLIHLDLSNTATYDNACTGLANACKLESLNLESTEITLSGLDWISNLPNLMALNCNRLDWTKTTSRTLKSLSTLTNIKFLSLSQNNIDAAELYHLENLLQLQSLDVSIGHLHDGDLAPLSNHQQLTHLNLSGNTSITGYGLVPLPIGLRRLNLGHTGLSNSSAENLLRFSNLEELELHHTEIGDQTLEILCSLKCLRRLNLGTTKVSSRAQSILDKFPALEEVQF